MSSSSGIFVLSLVILLEASKASLLSPFIQHYEMVNYDLTAVHRQHTRAVRSTSQEVVEIAFSSHNRQFHLRLKRDTSAFLPDVKLVTSTGEETPDVSYFYSGELADEPGSFCHGSITDGLFQGKIHTGGDVYSIEPATNYLEDAKSHSVIYKDKDLDYSQLGSSGCGFIGEIQKRMEKKMKEMEKEEKEQQRGEFSPELNREDSHLFNANPGRVLYPVEIVPECELIPQKIIPLPNGDGSSHFVRHKRQAPAAQTCSLFIRTDIEFYKKFGSRSAVIKQIGEHVQAATNIYSRTDFGIYQNINFAVAKIRIYTPGDEANSDYHFKDPNLGVEKYLDVSSIGDHSQYCLAYTFSNRDFANGVLGLAWIAVDRAASTGGLCAPKLGARDATLNTGIVTIKNYGSFVPPLMSHLTFAHEIGHSFGSNHDPMNNQQCSPGGARGNYLMYAHSSSGDLVNNDDFSSCSITMITSVLQSVFNGISKRNCFEDRAAVTFCGNEVLEEGEMCDCGYEQCDDPCCIAQNAANTQVNACQLKPTATCSPQQGECCDANTCSYKPKTYPCKEEDGCSMNANCTGSSVTCSIPAAKNDGSYCDKGRKVCLSGVCSRSVCDFNHLEECQCLTGMEQCEICCQNIGQSQSCVAASRIDIRGQNDGILYMDPGAPCNNYMGYCDFFDSCRQADENGPLTAILHKLFNSNVPHLTDAIWEWIQSYWWVIVIIILIIIITMILVVLCCQRVVPTTNLWQKEKEEMLRRSSVSVQLQKKRNRGSHYYGNVPPTSFDQHPDNAEARATPF